MRDADIEVVVDTNIDYDNLAYAAYGTGTKCDEGSGGELATASTTTAMVSSTIKTRAVQL